MDANYEALAWETFAGREGALFQIGSGEEAQTLRLDRAVQLSDSGRPGGAFRLEFVGPTSSMLVQATYILRDQQRGQDDEIFIVPIACTPEGARYEAIFY